MGAEACGCKKTTSSEISIDMFKPSTLQSQWSEAIRKNAVEGVTALHATDMDLIDLPIDANNICAIHVVIQLKHYDILDFLLKERFDINVQDTKYGNTALHLAVHNEDSKAIEKLFSYHHDDIDDKIKNYQGLSYILFCFALHILL